MATSELAIVGTITAAPQLGYPAGPATISAAIEERQYTSSTPVAAQYTLDADPAVSVAFGPLAEVHYVYIRPVGGEVRVRLTSEGGTAQVVPVNGLLILTSADTPFTAITLQRPAGVEVVVDVMLAEFDS